MREVNKPQLVSTTTPATMKAVVAPQPDGAEGLAVVDRPVPRPGKNEALVKVAAAGVNRPDLLQRRGLYPPPPGAPDILGLEIAGQVVEAGEGAEHLVGQSVCALVAGGGYAEYCAAPAGTCLPVPKGLSLVEAAAIPETLFTVCSNLFERGFAADVLHASFREVVDDRRRPPAARQVVVDRATRLTERTFDRFRRGGRARKQEGRENGREAGEESTHDSPQL